MKSIVWDRWKKEKNTEIYWVVIKIVQMKGNGDLN